jgi:hypothetical protein
MIKVRKLEPTDDRSDFRSGNPDLDRFFIHYAGQNQFRHHIGTTYIAVEGDRILGFVTVAPSQIEIDGLPRALRLIQAIQVYWLHLGHVQTTPDDQAQGGSRWVLSRRGCDD